jgi:hypothetical protein
VSEAHTADLGTRYRYRREGAEQERERIIKLLKKQLAEQNIGMFYADAISASILIIQGEE